MNEQGWLLLASVVVSTLAFAVSWAAWINSREAKEELFALRYKLRRELGSDGL